MDAEGASMFTCESLRQKDFCRTQLWRVFLCETTKEESHQVNFQVKRTGTPK